MFDILLRGGTVIDGTGRAAFAADIAVKDGKIAEVGHLPRADAGSVVDCTGLTVTPGFIDIHRHADGAVFRPDFGEWELRQGLTTIVSGNCGLSAAPFGPANAGPFDPICSLSRVRCRRRWRAPRWRVISARSRLCR